MKVLVTGGCGYIGSHTCVQLMQAGITPIIIDNLHNSSELVLQRIAKFNAGTPTFYEGDVRDRKLLQQIFSEHIITAVIHFAGLKAVGESVQQPLNYFENNVHGSLVLADEMDKAGVKSLLFSSSATVYGDPDVVPITESTPTGGVTNPYGRSKFMVEECLKDLYASDPSWSITLLRYFNPVGAHPSGYMGEDPQGIPNNLMPFIAQVAVGRRESLAVFGNDYETKDGTGVRDYVHVMDLADGHIAALNAVGDKAGLHIFNLGTGEGSSVLEMVDAFSAACGKPIKYDIQPRRSGDIAQCWADTEKARQQLNWVATRSLKEMAEDTWRWQSNNPNGYSE
ncbi:UDP-glucose 4-epimerase [Psychromonas marina]|uniref:UDP-glucose 4-epimerase n=1 Tax=Psychromonas marina TaxID=88364 RepID=A0ABQ6E3J4_9GAMM|nr:UDP-glucose 4-epimerase GalE [Psychromonas marina]GLS91775.1 UDP-glucose 4-epimerase [Psychromonas marina]